MRKPREATSVRLDDGSHKYLKMLASHCGQSITGALASIIGEREAAQPLAFTITRHQIPDADEECVLAVDGSRNSLCEGTFEKCLEMLAALRKEHEFDARRFPLKVEIVSLAEKSPV
jgi:hypothetical protein